MDFEWQDNAVQYYDLKKLGEVIKLPVPLTTITYNFFLFLESGSIKYNINNRLVEVVDSSIMCVMAQDSLAIHSFTKDISGYLIIIENNVFTNFLLSNKLLNFQNANRIVEVENSEWFSKIGDLIAEELNTASLSIATIHGLIQALLNKYYQLTLIPRTNSRSKDIVLKFTTLVKEFVIEEKSPVFYASKLGITTNYLNKCVRDYYVKTAKEIILEHIIHHAKILMWSKDKSISEICYILKFEDPSYFSRLFKKYVGVSPSRYQRDIQHIL